MLVQTTLTSSNTKWKVEAANLVFGRLMLVGDLQVARRR